MSRLWVKVIVRQRIDRQETAPCAWGGERDALAAVCKQMDLPYPIWLGKHAQEFDRYAKTSFLKGDFIEGVDFDRLEIDFLDDTDKKKRSRDPRNDFGSGW